MSEMGEEAPAHTFVVYRKDGFLITNDAELSFTLRIQDSKVRSTK